MKRPAGLKPSLLMALIVSIQAGCVIPSPQAGPEALARIERITTTAQLADGTDYDLSLLRTGDPALPRIIYVHGTPGDATNFLDYLAEPFEGFESIAIDRPGFGKSGPGKAVVDLQEQAMALEPLLVERGGVKPILVGHSIGGPIVAQAAADYPDRIGAVVILAGALDPGLEKVLFVQRIGNFAFVPWLLPKWAKHSNRELIALEDELRELEPRLKSVAAPVMIVHGTNDRLVPYANVPFMIERFGGHTRVELMTLDPGDHFLIWNDAESVRASIRRAIELAGPVPSKAQ